jgi:membrane protein implicated in regulation of membrane protease activity
MLLSQIYFVSALVGSVFIIFNFVMGQIGDGGMGDAGHDGGVGADGGDSPGVLTDSGSVHIDATNGDASDNTLSADGQTSMQAATGSYILSSFQSKTKNRLATSYQEREPLARLGYFVLSLLSPMSIAIFLTFFGLIGLVALHLAPLIGYLSLIPAILISAIVCNLFKALIRWMIKSMETSSVLRVDNLVGQVAEVNTPISDGLPGEITYVIGSKRYSSAAKAKKIGLEIKKGTQVMIVDTKEHLMLVEPYNTDN